MDYTTGTQTAVEFIKFDIDFAEDFIETRWQAFVNATESGLLNDNTLRYGSRQYWVRKELEPVGGKEFVIEDMFPDPGYRGIDDIYRISRPEILREGFNIANQVTTGPQLICA